MREGALQHLVCPRCGTDLHLEKASVHQAGLVNEGIVFCERKGHRFYISRFIPRFLSKDDTTASFGFEWNKHPRTQLDSANGMRVSEERFFYQTNWSRRLEGERILEVGCGAGRFTEIALQTGAEVISVDASTSIDANWRNNGHHSNLLLCQASLYELPFRQNYFDKVFCFGVLQHTPDVKRAFETIARFVKPGGELAVDVYNKDYWRNYHTPIYLIRPITKRIAHDKLYHLVSWSVPKLVPVSSWLCNNVPLIGPQLGAMIPVANYDGLLSAGSKELCIEYSILDTFDTVSPRYLSPQRPDTVLRWFQDAGFENIEFDRRTVFAMRGRRRLA